MSFRRAAQDIATAALLSGAGAYGVDLMSASRYLQLPLIRISASFQRSGLSRMNTSSVQAR